MTTATATKRAAPTPPEGIEMIRITPPSMATLALSIRGTEQYVSNRMEMKVLLEPTSPGGKGKKSGPRPFEAQYKASLFRDEREGWFGINASAFRQACVSACRLVGFKMTLAKLAIFIEKDGRDVDGTPLVRINGEPDQFLAYLRNANGSVDVRARGRFKEWACVVCVRYDTAMFSSADIVNLFARVGGQVGIGAGRPDSKSSAGMGWGLFEVEGATVIEKT